MICPLCGGRLLVIDSRNVNTDNSIIRRRRCENKDCKSIFYTREVEVPFENVNKDFNAIQNKYKSERRIK